MDLQQPVHNNISSCRSTSSSGTLEPPLSNMTITTSTTPSAATVMNNGTTTSTPTTSPAAIATHHHHHNHHHRNNQSLVTQKSNQVSTVLLYGIPIVSLYIESQERLCLAQISNTLLKQFSYNEIHNRRVALGITCVQCTPVQLEILRRAGAMPVSSRRCGMITRREAERLCKSFLGDNTPPRLPDDFAFNVQHKCAWGCRGSFLPARYNSSRAKCIKCHYCGMFFSPNKFIFHSHRIGPNDKYVQPDAANFNSWRRHMTLSGQPPEEVTFAWEDVKAMFNGGTRKRLMITNSSSPIPGVLNSSPSSSSAGASANSLSGEQLTTVEDDFSGTTDPLIKNIQKVQKGTNSINTVTAAAAVVGVTAVAVGSTVRPLNLHYQTTAASGLSSESSYSMGTDMHLLPAAALSRSFMMDYMWQHAHQAAKTSYQQQQQQQYQHHQQQQQKIKGCNSAFTLPWIKAAVGSTSFESQTTDNTSSTENNNFNGCISNNRYISPITSKWTNSPTSDITRNLTQIINTSAFKPVLQQQAITLTSTRPRRRQSTTTPPQPSNVTILRAATDSVTHPSSSVIPIPVTTQLDLTRGKSFKCLLSSGGEHDTQQEDEDDGDKQLTCDNKHFVSHSTAADSEAMDDDIMVDIETTEDEKPLTFSSNTITSTTCSRNSFTADSPGCGDEEDDFDHRENASSDEDVIDVEHNDNDDTVLELSTLTPLKVIKHTKLNNDKISMEDEPNSLTSPISLLKGPVEYDKFYTINKLSCLDYSNAENVPPPPISVSPSFNLNSSSSSCSRTNECFYLQSKGDNSNSNYEVNPPTSNTTTSRTSSSKSPETSDEQKFNFSAISLEKTHKVGRKRPSTKYHGENGKSVRRPIQDGSTVTNCENNKTDSEIRREECNIVETFTKCKKKSLETIAEGAQFFEALTQKYELTYYNNNNNNSCKNNYSSNSNNSNNSNTNNNNISNSNTSNQSNEFWHMARLCMQRPITYEQNQKIQQHQQQSQQQLSRLPTFYYRQQQFILTPSEQQQQQHYTSNTLPATQQVYLQLQQHQQNLQAGPKTQNSANEVVTQLPTTQPSSTQVSTNATATEGNDAIPSFTNFRQNYQDTVLCKSARANSSIG